MSPASSSRQASAVEHARDRVDQERAAVLPERHAPIRGGRADLASELAHAEARERLHQRRVLPARHARLHEGLLVVAAVRRRFDLVPRHGAQVRAFPFRAPSTARIGRRRCDWPPWRGVRPWHGRHRSRAPRRPCHRADHRRAQPAPSGRAQRARGLSARGGRAGSPRRRMPSDRGERREHAEVEREVRRRPEQQAAQRVDLVAQRVDLADRPAARPASARSGRARSRRRTAAS